MKRKIIFIIAFIIVAVGVTIASIINKHKPTVPYVDKAQTEVDKEKERLKKINEFAQYQGNSEDETEEPNYSGGEVDLSISNIGVLMKYKNPDTMVIINEKFSMAYKLLPIIYKDTINLSQEELKNYYNKNPDVLIINFGVDSHTKFKTLLEKLSFIGEKAQIIDVNIKEDTLNKIGNILTFELEFKSDNGSSFIIPIKIVITNENSVFDCLMYWV